MNDASVESEDKEKARPSKMGEKDSVGDDVDRELLASDSKLIVYNWVMSDPPPYEQAQDEKMDDETADYENTEKWWTKIKVTGSCLCKLFVVIYLMACLLVSALYIAIYGPNELFYLPEVQQQQHLEVTTPQSVPPRFYDNPYTEWQVQRWTYNDSHFADWPTLPDNITNIQQLAAGVVQGHSGVWILENNGLYFAAGLEGSSASFSNVSDVLGLNITKGSRLAMASAESLFVISPGNITLLDCSTEDSLCMMANSWEAPNCSHVHDALVSLSDGVLWIGTDVGLFRMDPDYCLDQNGTVVSKVEEVEGEVMSLAWRSSLSSVQSTGSDSSTFLFSSVSSQLKQNVSLSTGSFLHVGSCLEPSFGLLVVGTGEQLLFYNGQSFHAEWVSQWENGLGGVVDGPIVSIAIALSGEIFLGNNVSISRVNNDYTFDRLGPKQGLPYNHITSLFFSLISVKMPPATLPHNNITDDNSGTVWIGTEKGFMLFDVHKSEFISYHFGPRWHPGQSVLGLTGDDQSTVVLTNSGLSVLTAEEWTLEEKADHFQSMVHRHVRDPGLASDCPLDNFSPNSCSPISTDNDGLWTSWLAASEAFRYQVTGEHQAQSSSWAFFQGLKFLVQVTGVDGLPARSVVRDNVSVSGPNWHNSSTKPEWMWKGDTSSDEIVGHMFAHPIVYDLVAENDEQKQEVADMLESIIDYIKLNGYYLIDITNQSTQWGVWAPEQLNLNRSWADDRGINSLQILSYLMSAFRITGKEEYLSAWKELFRTPEGSEYPTNYGLNMVNCKITFPRDINYSDDELTFLPYFTFFQALKNLPEPANDTEYWKLLNLSLQRTWAIVGKERSAAWTAIFSYATGNKSQSLIEDIVWNLRTWPLELIEWTTNNSHRLDICLDPEQDRKFASHSQSMHVLPANERTQLRWNANPYQLDWTGSSTEMDPGPWLMPYWLARWTQLL